MAGIGFQLRKLNQDDTLSSVVASVGHASVIAAGPWLFTIFSLAFITITVERLVGLEALATFRIIIIYVFATSLVATAPVTIVATRRVADALWLKKPAAVKPLLFGAAIWALAFVAVFIGALLAYFRPPAMIALVLMAGSMLVGLIWVALCFCGAVRDYRGVTISFIGGLLVAVAASFWLAIMGLGPIAMAWGFLTGLAVTFFGMLSRILVTFPQPLHAPLEGVREVARGLREYYPLAVGAFAGTLGVWIDKWIFWFSAAGESVAGGLLHAPLYDSAMFISSLVIIPSLAAFVMKLETDFFDRYQRYYAVIGSHGTMAQIEDARARLQAYTLDNLTLITVAQVALCGILVLTAPLIVDALGLQFRQTAILRYGALGAVFQFIFIACTAMLLFFDRRRLYVGLQVLFLVLVAGFTLATLRFGDDYHGVGYFLACLATSFIAYRCADVTFDKLNFLTFLGNNPSIQPATAWRRKAWILARPTIARKEP